MSEVYRAHDLKLHRDVALKRLPEGSLADETARSRFRREAHALSRFSHPHVATLLDFDTEDGADFLVLELVTGPSLEELLRAGPLPEKDVLRLGAQLARGLQAAHDHGIIHRDLKPSNLAFTPDGLLKILDFGLARLLRPEPGGARAETATETAAGTVMGSPPYMAPEQLLGEPPDARTDLYAAGAVLYEMATGRRPFGTRSGIALTDAILHEPPAPPRSASPRLSPGLEQVIVKALDKDPELRYQSAKDLLVDLERLQQRLDSVSSGSGPATAPAPAWARSRVRKRMARRRALLPAAGLALLGLGAGLAWWFLLRGPEVPALRAVPLTTDPGFESWPTFSPDGTRVAFQGAIEGKDAAILVKQVGEDAALPRTSGAGFDHAASWSPDGRWIAFLRGEDVPRGRLRLMVIPAVAGVERGITWIDAPVGWGFRPAWTPDSAALIFPDREDATRAYALYRVSLEDGSQTRWTSPPEGPLGDGDKDPALSPDGTRLAFTRNGDLYLVNLDSTFRPASPPREVAKLGELTGSWGVGGPWGLAWTADSREIIFSAGSWPRARLHRVSAGGGPVRPLPALGPGAFAPATSRTGGRLAYMEWITSADIWETRLDGRRVGSVPERLIASSRMDFGPVYSPDGRRIAFHSNRTGVWGVWIASASGTSARLLRTYDQAGDPWARRAGFGWSPDGRSIVLADSDLHVVDVESGAGRALTMDGTGHEFPVWSPDGQWVFFNSRVDGTSRVYRIPARGGEPEPVTREEGRLLAIAPDGLRLYVERDGRLWAIPTGGGGEAVEVLDPAPRDVVATGGGFFYSLLTPVPVIRYRDLGSRNSRHVAELDTWPAGFSVSPDGRRLAHGVFAHGRVDLMLVEGFR